MARERTGSARYEAGQWYAFFYDPTGRRRRVKIDGLTRPDDEAAARAYAREVSCQAAAPGLTVTQPEDPPRPHGRRWAPAELSAYAPRLPDGRETAAGWFVRWLEDRRGRRELKAVDSDASRVRFWLAPAFGCKAMAEVSRADVEALVETLDAKQKAEKGPLSAETCKRVWSLCRRAFRDARGSKHRALRCRQDDPTDGVEGPEGGASKAKVYLLPREADVLLRCEAVPVDYRRLYAVAIYTGLRTAEIAALAPVDVHLEGGYLAVHKARGADGAVRSPKSIASVRRVPVEPMLAPLLDRLIEEARAAGSQRLVDWPPERHLARDLRGHLWIAGLERDELYARDPERKPLTFHDLRASYATWQALRGDLETKIQRRLGHTNIGTTQIYVREAEALGNDVGVPFGPLPPELYAARVGGRAWNGTGNGTKAAS